MMKVILDVDCGVDDSLALLYILQKQGVEVLGITSVFGNVDVEKSADNVCRILDLVHVPADIPVVVGAGAPVEGEWDGPVPSIHGENGLGNAKLPPSARRPEKTAVEDFLNSLAAQYPNEITLITLGRLTNVANTLKKYPQFGQNIRNLVMMGGSLHHTGNVTPVAEANVAGDPRACDQVFCSGIDVTVVGLDVTMKTRLKREYIEDLKKRCSGKKSALAEYICTALGYYFEGNHKQDGCIDDCPLHDPLAAIAAVKPELFTFQKLKARVECGGEYCRGMIVTDRRHRPFEAEYVKFAVDVDAKAALRELLSVF